jgi:hypothetical protein
MLCNRDSTIQKYFQKILHSLQGRKFYSQSTVRTPICPKCQQSGRPSVQSIIRPDDENFRSEPSHVSRIFELLQLASVQTFQQHVRTTLSVRDRCNRPDALIHKASIAFKIQTSERQLAWFRRACIRYGNCVHQINRSDDHSPSLDARNFYMGIACSGSTTVRTTRHHRPDTTQKQERISVKFSGSRSYSCSFERPLTTVWMAPIFIKPDAHLNPQPINRGP